MLVVSILMQTGLTTSAPMPLLMIVNNDSMECARFLPGDECMDCSPPAAGIYWAPMILALKTTSSSM